jgi:hypothetical protein
MYLIKVKRSALLWQKAFEKSNYPMHLLEFGAQMRGGKNAQFVGIQA